MRYFQGGETVKANKIAYRNLRAEMGRNNIGIGEMAKDLRCNRDTLSRKLSGKSPITLEEAFEIQQRFFPDEDVNYLFHTEKD